MKLSILNYIKSASDETLMEMAKLTQTEQREREAQKEAKKDIILSAGLGLGVVGLLVRMMPVSNLNLMPILK